MNPFDLPVHPVVVHFPLAMLVAAWVSLLLEHRTRSATWADRTRLFEVIGVATLPITIVAGFIDTRGFSPLTNPRWELPLIWHLLAALTGAALFTAHWAWRRNRVTAGGGAAILDVGLATVAM